MDKEVYYINKITGELHKISQEYFKKYMKDDGNCYEKLTEKEYNFCSLAQNYVFNNYV